MTDEHLKNGLRVASTSIKVNLNRVVQKKKPAAHWHSSHLAILALRQGRQAARGRQNEAAQCTQQAKLKNKKTKTRKRFTKRQLAP